MFKKLDRWIRLYAGRVAQMGLGAATLYAGKSVVNRMLGREWGAMSLSGRRNVYRTYHMVDKVEVKVLEGELVPRSINWIVPRFSIGSGGHLTIFRMISMLERRGFVCRIFITEKSAFLNAEQAREIICEHFVKLNADVYLGVDAMPPCSMVMATSWDTVYWAAAFRGAERRMYFVQDFEPHFYAHSSEYAFAEQTYRMGFDAVTAGDWLAEKLHREYGMRTQPFSFSFDKGIHQPGPRDTGPRRVFFYARHVTPRRGFELGLLALRRVHERLPDVEFVFAGWDMSEFDVPFPHLNAGVVTQEGLAKVYTQCDAALVLSLTNLSLLPLELMACGCPVVSNNGANVEWLLKHGENALLSDPSPAALADNVVAVLEDAALRKKIVEGGFRSAAASDWEKEGARVADFIDSVLATPAQSVQADTGALA